MSRVRILDYLDLRFTIDDLRLQEKRRGFLEGLKKLDEGTLKTG
jgi:hypothetical protein